MRNQNTPKFSGPFEYRHGFIAPPEMLATVATKGHTPSVARKPGISLGSSAMSNCTRAFRESVKITFYPCRVYEKMPVASLYANQLIRIAEEARTADALVDFGTITTNSFQRGYIGEHSSFQIWEGLMPGRIANGLQKSILATRDTVC